jgi:Skp family chaperone for outer membrane proteins
MENMYKSATVISIISFVLIVIYVVYAEANRTNLAYVELGEVFENFQMKKDLEKEIEKIKAENSNTLNKLIMEYNRIVQRIDSSGGNDTLRQHAYQLREQIDIFNNEIQTKEENTSAEYDNQIWSRINQYI